MSTNNHNLIGVM